MNLCRKSHSFGVIDAGSPDSRASAHKPPWQFTRQDGRPTGREGLASYLQGNDGLDPPRLRLSCCIRRPCALPKSRSVPSSGQHLHYMPNKESSCLSVVLSVRLSQEPGQLSTSTSVALPRANRPGILVNGTLPNATRRERVVLEPVRLPSCNTPRDTLISTIFAPPPAPACVRSARPGTLSLAGDCTCFTGLQFL